jgi:hypothetical protein
MRPEVFAQPNSEQIAFSFTIEASNRYPYGNVGHYLTGLRLILSIHSIYGIVREPRGRLTKEFDTERNLRNAHLYRGTSKRIQERTGPHTSRSLTARTFASPKDVGKCIVPNITTCSLLAVWLAESFLYLKVYLLRQTYSRHAQLNSFEIIPNQWAWTARGNASQRITFSLDNVLDQFTHCHSKIISLWQ